MQRGVTYVHKQVVREGLDTIDLTTWVANNFGQVGLRSAAESGAVGTLSEHFSSDLETVIAAWETLSEQTRDAILGLIEND